MKWIVGRFLTVTLGITLVTGCVTMQSRWEEVRSADTISAYEEFLRQYPQKDLSKQAYIRINALRTKEEELKAQRDFEKAKAENTIDAYRRFLSAYLSSTLANEAKLSIEELIWEEISKKSDEIGDMMHVPQWDAAAWFYQLFPHSRSISFAGGAGYLRSRTIYADSEMAIGKGALPVSNAFVLWKAYNAYISDYPKSKYFTEAKAKKEEMERIIWEGIKLSGEVDYFIAYTGAFPESKFINEVKFKIKELESEIWQKTKQQDTLKAYSDFIVKYSDTRYLDFLKKNVEAKLVETASEEARDSSKILKEKLIVLMNYSGVVRIPNEMPVRYQSSNRIGGDDYVYMFDPQIMVNVDTGHEPGAFSTYSRSGKSAKGNWVWIEMSNLTKRWKMMPPQASISFVYLSPEDYNRPDINDYIEKSSSDPDINITRMPRIKTDAPKRWF